MSARATGWALAQQLPPVTKLVLVALADEVRRDGTSCFPARRTLAADVGIKPRAISNHLADLERRGLLRREERFRDNGSRTSTLYHLAIDGPFEQAVTTCTLMQGGARHDGATAPGTDLQGPVATAGAGPEPGSEPGSEPPPVVPRKRGTSRRKRDRDHHNDQVAAWAAEHLPDLHPRAVAEIAHLLRRAGREATPDAIRSYAAERMPSALREEAAA